MVETFNCAAEEIREIEEEIEEEYKATSVDINTFNGNVNIEIRFQGFKNITTATEKVIPIAKEVSRGVEDYSISFNSHSATPIEEEADPHPSATITLSV